MSDQFVKNPPMLKPLKGPPLVDVKLFASVSGIKLDQLAGFIRYSKDQKLGPMTIEQWKKALSDFQQKGVK